MFLRRIYQINTLNITLNYYSVLVRGDVNLPRSAYVSRTYVVQGSSQVSKLKLLTLLAI